eukprot:5484663-Prorocentrum_lima.AAC.1
MTSSLVGSEMCIRDCFISAGFGPDGDKYCKCLRGGQPDKERGTCKCPVSYTHLTLPTICSV